MASYDQLPSGLWRATVVTPIRLPSGRSQRITKTAPLKEVVETWAKIQEGAIAAGTWVTPKAGELTLGEFRDQWRATRLERGTSTDKVDSFWRTHIEARWAGYPLQLIARPGLLEWVKYMAEDQCRVCRAAPGVVEDDDGLVLADHTRTIKWGTVGEDGKRKRVSNRKGNKEQRCPGAGQPAGLGPWTIQGVVSHLSGLLGEATRQRLIAANPATQLELPTVAPKPVFFWTRDQAAQILLELGGPDALLVESELFMGLRPGEMFGLRRRFVDDAFSWQVHVYGVATRAGWRPYAKTKKSHRPVPIPKHLRQRWAERLEGLGPDDLVFPAPGGGTWDDRTFATQVFAPAVQRAGVPAGTPYDMRHTAASWLVQRGVELLRVQELLGHEKYATTLRYAHLRPKAFDEVLDAWGDEALDPRATKSSRTGEGVGS